MVTPDGGGLSTLAFCITLVWAIWEWVGVQVDSLGILRVSQDLVYIDSDSIT
jgi:hypothetical protein